MPRVQSHINLLSRLFYIGRQDGKPHYTNNQNDFRCPFCNHGIAANEELAMERLREGYRK